MRFLAILKSGVSEKNVALEFVQLLLRKSWQENELSLEVACDFVNDILLAIGLECVITPEQINDGWSYVWPIEQIQIYNFHYIEKDFKKLEVFLREVCDLVRLQNEIYINELKDLHDAELESPVEYLMQLTAVWCSVFKQLQKLEVQKIKRFEEPFSRINFQLLLGMHELRKLYRLDLHLLDAICNRLYWSALQGLFYRQTHDMIFSGLLEIFSKNYDLFYASCAPTMNFFYEAFAVEINNLTPKKLYETLQKMLLDDVTSHKLKILLDFLSEPFMLQVYFTTFLARKCKCYNKITTKNIEKIQQEAIKFLNILQSKLISLDCFSREFMEAILNLVFKTDHITSNLACNLYITMMKRKCSDKIILKHLMDFYVAHVGSLNLLKPYVEAVHKNFEFLLDFNSLLEIITDHQTTEIIRFLSAHILVVVFELKVQKKDLPTKNHLQDLLEIFPVTLENLHCQRAEGILLKVYSYIPMKKLPKPILDNFIHYSVGIFTYTDSSLEYPLLMNIFSIFHKCLVFNKEWRHLEILSDSLFIKYQKMVEKLKQSEQNQQELVSKQSLGIYNGLIKRLNIILKTKYNLLDDYYLEFIGSLSQFFLYNLEIKSVIFENKSLIDSYVLEIVVCCIIKLGKHAYNNNETYQKAQELYKYLWLIIKDLEELLKFPTVRIKTYFCSFVQLAAHVPLKFDSDMYHQLVKILVMVNFENKSQNRKAANESQQIHPLQSLDYQRLMMRQFTELHKYQRVEIRTNTVWKLCIYYGIFKHNFQEELKNLLITLAKYRFNIYKNIISVLIYNLYNKTPALKHTTIMFVLKQHKNLIDNDIKVESSKLLKVHVVLLVLQILVKALNVQQMKKGCNRLEALKHLSIFIEDLDLNKLQAKQLLLEQLNTLRKHLMDAEETKTLSDFKELLK